MQKLVRLLFFARIFTFGEAYVDISSLSDTIKQQIFDIYTGVALMDKGVEGDNVTAENIKYYLWATDKAQNYTIVNSTTPSSVIKNDALYVFFIHGWFQSKDTEWYGLLKNSFFEHNPDYYIVQVDWSLYASKNYLIASYDTKPVGDFIGEFIVNLNKNYSVPCANILIVGHSFGGQVSGFVGKKVRELIDEKLPRIVALDPAGPLFENRPEEERLNPRDAAVVQVIHTNGGVFGFLKVCGTIDFFPNGGTQQPGCVFQTLLTPSDIDDKVSCSHDRSWRYFAEAVPSPEKFNATKCDSWLKYISGSCEDDYETMGNLNTNKTGKYYLTTNSQPPYSK